MLYAWWRSILTINYIHTIPHIMCKIFRDAERETFGQSTLNLLKYI